MLTFSRLQSLRLQLLGFWSPEVERCGVVHPDLRIEEVQNRSPTPELTFLVTREDLDRPIEATWHTHPATSANLSVLDHHFFMAWPHLLHFIVGQREVRCYQVLNGVIYCVDEEDDYSPRLPEGSVSSRD